MRTPNHSVLPGLVVKARRGARERASWDVGRDFFFTPALGNRSLCAGGSSMGMDNMFFLRDTFVPTATGVVAHG